MPLPPIAENTTASNNIKAMPVLGVLAMSIAHTPANTIINPILAKARLANAQSSTDEWSVTTLYAPMREGEIALFTKEGTTHVCLIKSITVDCVAKTMQVTLKGLA